MPNASLPARRLAPLAGAVVQLADERDPAHTFSATADSPGHFRVQEGGLDFDALVSPRRIMGVEVYRTGANVPAEYAPTSNKECGVILVWPKPY